MKIALRAAAAGRKQSNAVADLQVIGAQL